MQFAVDIGHWFLYSDEDLRLLIVAMSFINIDSDKTSQKFLKINFQ